MTPNTGFAHGPNKKTPVWGSFVATFFQHYFNVLVARGVLKVLPAVDVGADDYPAAHCSVGAHLVDAHAEAGCLAGDRLVGAHGVVADLVDGSLEDVGGCLADVR